MPMRAKASQRQNRTRPAILGVLARCPATGYEIRRHIAGTLGHFWQESMGQLYPTLAALAREGLIRVVDKPSRDDRKRIRYTLTRAGRATLEAWLAQPPARPIERNEMLLKLFFADLGRLDDAERHLAARLADVREQREALQTREREVFGGREPRKPELLLGWLTLQYGLAVFAAQMKWCESVLDRLRRVEA